MFCDTYVHLRALGVCMRVKGALTWWLLSLYENWGTSEPEPGSLHTETASETLLQHLTSRTCVSPLGLDSGWTHTVSRYEKWLSINTIALCSTNRKGRDTGLRLLLRIRNLLSFNNAYESYNKKNIYILLIILRVKVRNKLTEEKPELWEINSELWDESHEYFI